jgi:Rrf2 family transcriptional regulator, iron-sulfur cluster assembly transcription factor
VFLGFRMELSRATQCALRTVLDLAIGGPSRVADVAERRGIPLAAAGKIVQALTRSGIVLSSRGAHGGIRLGRPADKVTLRDVVEAIEGPIVVARCLKWNDCPCDQPCPVRAALTKVQRTVDETLDAVRVSDLVRDERRRVDRAHAVRSASPARPSKGSVLAT